MRGYTVLAVGAMLVALCTMCVWLSPDPGAVHPDAPIVRSAAAQYLDAHDIALLDYEGHGGSGGDGFWWARIRLLQTSKPPPNPPDGLRAFARKWRTWTFDEEYLTRGDLAKVKGPPPDWWKINNPVYSVRMGSNGGGFFATPADAPNEWCIMQYGR